ncbi:hypothetical protein HN415_07325 [Candidatus Woesearchaeota archaeon]|jgi:hypothetical protein|nr:hypothetical protein [Candidatus Woesearchaeota archaeon]
MEMYNKKEILNLFLSTVILGFIFSARGWGYSTFNFGIGLSNLLRMSILSFIILLIYQTSHKLIAKKYHAHSTFRIWSLQRWWFTKNAKFKKPFAAGIILPLFFSLISNGFLKFAAIGSSEITSIERKRIGKKYKHISEHELAKIHLVGPFTILLLSLILIQFPGFDEIVKIAYTLSIFSMLPISGLDGAKIFFGSLPLYLFGVGFISLSIILIHLLAPIWILVISIITAIILSLIFLESNF